MKLSTLRQYVRALGGDLQLMVTFPGDAPVSLRDIGILPERYGGAGARKTKLRKTA
jgi:hypothetical protein